MTQELERRPYTASTGRVFDLIRCADAQGEHWIFEWDEPSGYRVSWRPHYDQDRLSTADMAIERIEAQERIRTATESLPETLTREQYEAACQRAGLEPQTDEQILRQSYALTYFDMPLSQYTASEIIAAEIAKRRLRLLQTERAAAQEARLVRRMRRRLSLDTIAPAGTTVTRLGYGTSTCAKCGAPTSYWNPGAARYLCREHWDDY